MVFPSLGFDSALRSQVSIYNCPARGSEAPVCESLCKEMGSGGFQAGVGMAFKMTKQEKSWVLYDAGNSGSVHG